MITPTKYLDLDTCTLNIAAHVIEVLHSTEQVDYSDLVACIIAKLGAKAEYDIPSALGLLFLLDRVQYLPATDTVSLTVPRIREGKGAGNT